MVTRRMSPLVEWPTKCNWVISELNKRDAQDLINSIKLLRDSAQAPLFKINETFPDYTIHDIRHKDTVCAILGWLIPTKVIEKMNKYEIYFVVAATYLHDVGMADIEELFDQNRYAEWLEKKKVDNVDTRREFIREYHHERSKEYIMKHFTQLSIASETEAYAIGLIAMGHRGIDDLKDLKTYNRKFMVRNNLPVNIASLAFYLQVADELDLTFERVPVLMYNSFYPKNQISRDEWDKAISSSGVGLDPDDNRKIRVTAICKNQRVDRTPFAP
jgi:molecular chaperone HtpG